MLEIIKAGGWVMGPIVLCSVLALGITVERLWSLRGSRVVPDHLIAQVWHLLKHGGLDEERIRAIRESSPLGRVLAAGLVHRDSSREIMKEHIEDIGRHTAHDLERHLNALGTVAAISPLLGLLGTVSGLIDVFNVITRQGVGDPAAMAGGISEALITTVAGLSVAIPALIAYRHLKGRVAEHAVRMEQEAIKLVEALAQRRNGGRGA